MPAPTTSTHLLELIRLSRVVDPQRLESYLQQLSILPDQPKPLADLLVKGGLLTYFQSAQLLRGKWKGFFLGKYRVLEQIGNGGMGNVFLCEHQDMRRRVAVKVLPIKRAEDPSYLKRFQREAQAVAALDPPHT